MKLEEIQNVAFEMIAAASTARATFQTAIDKAKGRQFEEAQALLKKGSQELADGSRKHFAIIQEEAEGIEQPCSVLFIHAEDQLIMTEIMRDYATELIEIHEELTKVKEKLEKEDIC